MVKIGIIERGIVKKFFDRDFPVGFAGLEKRHRPHLYIHDAAAPGVIEFFLVNGRCASRQKILLKLGFVGIGLFSDFVPKNRNGLLFINETNPFSFEGQSRGSLHHINDIFKDQLNLAFCESLTSRRLSAKLRSNDVDAIG